MQQLWLIYILMAIMVLCIVVVVAFLVWWKRWHTGQLTKTDQELQDRYKLNILDYAIHPYLSPCEIACRQERWKRRFILFKNCVDDTPEGQKLIRWTQLLADHWGIEPYISINPEEGEDPVAPHQTSQLPDGWQ